MNAFSCLSPSELVVRWANVSYEFGESDPATVQLITDSVFESATVRIQGFPRCITAAPPRLPSFTLCGPRVPGRGHIMNCQMYLYNYIVFVN